MKSYADKRIKIIRNKTNLRLPKTLNIGIDASKGKYIARMDANDISYKDRFSKQILLLDKNDEIGVCGTNIKLVDESGNVIMDKLWEDVETPLEWQLLWENPIAHTSVFLRKEVIDKYGFHYRDVYAEDGDLWCRMVTKTRLKRIDEVLMDVLIQQDSESSNNRVLHMKQAIESSLEYAKWLTGRDVPSYHQNFLIYSKVIQKDNFSMPSSGDLLNWFIEVDNSINMKFKFTDTEQKNIHKDIVIRIIDYYKDLINKFELKNNEQTLLFEEKERNQKKDNEELKQKYEKLESVYKKILSSRSYNISQVSRKYYRMVMRKN